MNPLVNRIWDIWTKPSQQELLHMINDFRLDYIYDDSFLHALDIIEEAVLDENYDRALVIFEEMRPFNYLTVRDFNLFVEILDEANYGY
jgi:hypothetical protein